MLKSWRFVTGALLSALMGCATGNNPPRVTVTQDEHFLASGYGESHDGAVWNARREAQRYCWYYEDHKKVMPVKQATVYRGRYNEALVEASKIAGKTGSVLGRPDVDLPRQILSESDDYETTFEFICR